MYDRVAGKGGTYPRRYHVSLHHKDHSEGEMSLFTHHAPGLSRSVSSFHRMASLSRLQVVERSHGSVVLRGTCSLLCLHAARSTAARRVWAAGSWSTPRAGSAPRIAPSPTNVSGNFPLCLLIKNAHYLRSRTKIHIHLSLLYPGTRSA